MAKEWSKLAKYLILPVFVHYLDCLDETKEIERVPVAKETKYLGKNQNKKDKFRDQRRNMMKKTQKVANVANRMASKNCNKVMIGFFFGKILPYQEHFMQLMS